MTRLPTLFVSHGSPTFALEPGRTGPALARFAQGLPPLRAILVVSPHWSTRSARVTARERQEAWHDFGGFPPALYALRYAPPGAPWLAERVIALLGAAGVTVEPDARRPLDHGAWVPLMHMYPHADVPVVQLSLQPHLPPAQQWAIGHALSALRDEGVLVIGSGSITHNLGDLDWADPQAPVAPWAQAFRGWIGERLAARDLPALFDYRAQAPYAVHAHPTDEHLLPIFVALGAAGDDAAHARRLDDEVTHATLAMDAYEFGAPTTVGAIDATQEEPAQALTGPVPH